MLVMLAREWNALAGGGAVDAHDVGIPAGE